MATSAKAAPSTAASSGTKRKRASESKFYAVAKGHTPGVYNSWADCQQQTTGFKGAKYKSFTSLGDAEAYAKGNYVASSTSTPKKFYAVQSGRVPGVYTDWPSAQEQIVGWTKPKHKAFTTRTEAEAFVKQAATQDDTASSVFGTTDADSLPASKKSKTSTKALREAAPMAEGPGFDYLEPDAEDGFDPKIIMDPVSGEIRYKTDEEMNATKLMPKTDHFGETLHIWTDGACLANGRPEAIAGVGVWFGPNDPRNLHEPLLGKRQTNQRAELTALKRALDHSPLNRNVLIHSDSNYAINCVTKWFINWRSNGWLNAAKKPVDNRDLVEEIIKVIDNRHLCRSTTGFEWVKGHGSDEGNNGADLLAVLGAQEAKARGLSLVGGGVDDEE